jgi:DNA-binding MarR family transcriptional regulator
MHFIKLNEIIHQSKRFLVVASLYKNGPATFKTIKSTFNLSDGHMTRHMKVLCGANYIDKKKEFVNEKPRTTYALTSLGRIKFEEHLKSLSTLLGIY